MSNPTNGYGDSTVATAYVWSRIHDILDADDYDQMCQELSDLHGELAHNFKVIQGLKLARLCLIQERRHWEIDMSI